MLSATLCVVAAVLSGASSVADKPNIIWVMADDMVSLA
jgi:hypothetical protein